MSCFSVMSELCSFRRENFCLMKKIKSLLTLSLLLLSFFSLHAQPPREVGAAISFPDFIHTPRGNAYGWYLNHQLQEGLQDTAAVDSTCIFRTQTQGGWGSPPNGNNPGAYLHANFDSAFLSGIVVGCDSGFTLTLTTAQAVTDYLPAGGRPAALTASLTDPTGYSNNLASQLVTLALTLGFDQYDAAFGSASSQLADATIASGAFAGWTVQMVFDEANAALGGCSSTYNASTLSGIVAAINESFVDGNIHNSGLLVCAQDTCPQLAFQIEGACLGEPTLITNHSTNVDSGATYYFDLFSDGTIDLAALAADLPDDTSVLIPYADTFSYTIVVVNGNGCSDTLTGEFIVEDCPQPCIPPQLAFSFDDTICDGLPFLLSNQSQGVDANATYYLDINNDGNVEFTAPASDLPDDTLIYIPLVGEFEFSVIVVNSDGCSDTLVQSIEILPLDSCVSNDFFEFITLKKEKESSASTVGDASFSINAYPNPFNETLSIAFMSAEDTRVKLEIFNLAGQRVAQVFEGDVQGGVGQQFEFTPEQAVEGMYIYRLQTSGRSFYGKAVMVK